MNTVAHSAPSGPSAFHKNKGASSSRQPAILVVDRRVALLSAFQLVSFLNAAAGILRSDKVGP